MATKDKLLALLEAHKREYLSGEELAQSLSVSRTAVWKAANALRGAGYSVKAVQNRGYCLDAAMDILSLSGIQRRLNADAASCQLELVSCTASTNALVRERAVAGAAEGLVILANQQTSGRGRLGRSFYSPPDSGLYMSLLLRPAEMVPAEAVKLTAMAAVAACKAIGELAGEMPQIKWVNDIFMGGKKVCGILTEGSYSLESGSLDEVIVGAGFNVYPPAGGFPKEIQPIAGAILPEQRDGGKDALAAAFLSHFFSIYHNPESSGYAAAYREQSCIIGRPIRVHTPSGDRNAYALDIDRNCRLLVRYEDGTIAQLSSAEVSIRT